MRAIKNIRLKEYDYKANGFYFVTICTDFSKPLLTGKIKDVVARFIGQLPAKIPRVAVDYYVIMPTHLHIILVLDDCKKKLGEIIREFKAATSHESKVKLWQPNYFEHIIRDEKALRKIREYIVNNPIKAELEFEQFYL